MRANFQIADRDCNASHSREIMFSPLLRITNATRLMQAQFAFISLAVKSK